MCLHYTWTFWVSYFSLWGFLQFLKIPVLHPSIKKRCCHIDCTCQCSFNVSSCLGGCSSVLCGRWYEHYRLSLCTRRTVVNRIPMNHRRALISGPSPDVESLLYPAESQIFIAEKSLPLTLCLTSHAHEKKWEALMPKSYMQRISAG